MPLGLSAGIHTLKIDAVILPLGVVWVNGMEEELVKEF
jgi:hypothetical protein